jgi:hypothetical protein
VHARGARARDRQEMLRIDPLLARRLLGEVCQGCCCLSALNRTDLERDDAHNDADRKHDQRLDEPDHAPYYAGSALLHTI